jgi:hypothetical protein
VQIEQVKDDPLGQVTKGAVVHMYPLARVDHLDPMQILLFHGFEMRYP